MSEKLRWACRRGMLELDILLNHFLTTTYPTLCVDQQQTFIELLSQTDQDLYQWLIQRLPASHPVWQSLINLILSHADQKICT